MNLGAQILAGDPPTGLGAFLRDSYVPGPWNFVLVNAWRGDAQQLVQTARNAGVGAWLYGTPEHFRPDTWREGLAYLLERKASLGADGVMVDAEDGWGTGHDNEASAMGTACRTASSDTRIGFTSVPSWGPLRAFTSAAGESVFGVIQMYGHSVPGPLDEATMRAWWARWSSVFGVRLAPAIAGWVANPLQSTPAGYASYLAMVPRSSCSMVWLELGVMPSFIVSGLASYQPGGSSVGTLAQSAVVFAARPAGVFTIIAAAIAVALVGFIVWGASRA